MSLLVATGGIVRARQLRAPLIDYSTDLTFTRSGEAANFDPRTGAFLAAAGTDWREDEHTLPLAISSWTDAGTPGETTGVSDHLGGSDAVTTEDADAGAFEGHTHSTGFSVVAGRLYRTTTWIKKDTDETRFPELQNVSSSGFAHWQLNTKTGAATVRVSNGFTDLSLSVTEAVSGWWRVVFTFRPNISAGFLARVYPAAAVSLGGSALATTTGALTWYPAIQLDGEAAWLPTDVPRILDDGAILIEGAATNRVTHSQDFDNAFWSKLTDPPTVTANSATAPDGTTTADEILFNSAAGVGDLRSGALGLTDSLDYAYSVFLQSPADAPASVRTSMRNKASTDIRTVRAVPATWTRYADRQNAATGGGTPFVGLQEEATGLVGAAIEWWGAQMELGYPTSPIRTTGAIASRSADLGTLTIGAGLAADLVQASGFVVDFWPSFHSSDTRRTNMRLLDIGTGHVGIYFSGTTGTTIVLLGGATSCSVIVSSGWNAGDHLRATVKIPASGSHSLEIENLTQATGPYSASDASPATLSLASKVLTIGGYGGATSFNFDGAIGRIAA